MTGRGRPGTAGEVRPYTGADAEAVLALNQANVPEVGSIDAARLAALARWATRFEVVEVDGRIVGFLIGLDETAGYDSPNFGWFAERHPTFAYVDRVAVAAKARGAGWGPELYRRFETWAVEAGKPILCAEVNTEPPNPRSLRFHDLFGFAMVAQVNPTGDPAYRVGMMEKRIP
ncbi:MAG: GNAT family N-acetyltransferase [Acidimicrobiales bacterium]